MSKRITLLRAGKLPAIAACGLALLALGLPQAARGQDSAQDNGQAGQPARAVRLSYVDGKVTLSQNGQPVAAQAVINTPLVAGMTLTSGEDGKAAIQFEDGSVARIAPNSSLTLSTLTGAGTSAQAELSVDRGEAYFELQDTGQAGTIRVRFGNTVVTGSGFTILRVQDDTPPGSLAVFSGNAHVDRGSGSPLDLSAGQSVDFATGGTAGYKLSDSIPPDSWDAWNSDRDEALNAEAASQVSQTAAPGSAAQGQAGNPAWSDLDANGTWYDVPGQGYVWSPYDASSPGFDPYGYGNWVWVPGFGYTWASGYSWGYLPFSCGIWNYYDGFGWGWAPGFGVCSPWWTTGFYGGPAIGLAPVWYHPIHRPAPPGGTRSGHPAPLIAVDRHEQNPVATLPPRDRATRVTIGGSVVTGLRSDPRFSGPTPGVVVRGFNSSTNVPGKNPGSRPVYIAPHQSGNRPALQPGTPGGQRPGNSTRSPQPSHVMGSSPRYRSTYAPPSITPFHTPERTYTPPPGAPSGGGFRGGAPRSGGSGREGGGTRR